MQALAQYVEECNRLRKGARLLIAAVALLAFALVAVGVRSVRALNACEAPIVIMGEPRLAEPLGNAPLPDGAPEVWL